MLQTFFNVAPSCRACQLFIQGLALPFALLATAIIWSCGVYINIILSLTNCYGITNLFFMKIWKSDLFTKILYYENLETERLFWVVYALTNTHSHIIAVLQVYWNVVFSMILGHFVILRTPFGKELLLLQQEVLMTECHATWHSDTTPSILPLHSNQYQCG